MSSLGVRTLPFLSFPFLITHRPSVNTIRKWMRKLRFRVVQWISPITQLVNVISGLGLWCSDSGLVSHLPQNGWALKFSSLLGWGMDRYRAVDLSIDIRGDIIQQTELASGGNLHRQEWPVFWVVNIGRRYWKRKVSPSPGSTKPLQRSQRNKIQKSRRTVDSARWHQINLSEGLW